MNRAIYLRTMPPNPAGADQRLYRCEPPMYGHIEHVIVSKVVVRAGHPIIEMASALSGGLYGAGPETYAFRADAQGEITSWSELPCSMKGECSHADVLADAGYEIAEVCS